MTLPDERYRSLVHTKLFLMDLTNVKKIPRIPKIIRQRALSLLRHWPDDHHLQVMTEQMPEHFAKNMEPLYRMIKQYDHDLKESQQPKETHDNK